MISDGKQAGTLTSPRDQRKTTKRADREPGLKRRRKAGMGAEQMPGPSVTTSMRPDAIWRC
ncbi:hypothetical protein K0M31_014256 [Melipona bicolor]|uniref:Uncharacterized protein n=1 Tax=Melipona bicolor TaxID=60889 RepID=A0AA40G8A0_9HYME|nr:hypothetical protein K0M31_014256 [Melipona bicolor]